jgi:hypothetical protein
MGLPVDALTPNLTVVIDSKGIGSSQSAGWFAVVNGRLGLATERRPFWRRGLLLPFGHLLLSFFPGLVVLVEPLQNRGDDNRQPHGCV